MTKFNNGQSTQQPQIYIPPSARRDPDFDDEKVPVSQRLGDFSDQVFGFVFSPNTIKFGILLFAGFCIAINLAGYYDLVNQVFTTRLDELGRTLPVEAPIGDRIMNSIVRLPFLGTALVWLDQLTGGLVALVGAIERVYKAVSKYAADYRSDQNKLLTGMVISGVLGLPVFFPFGVPSLLIAGAIGASAVSWQELGAMRDRLKPEYLCLKNSVLLEQFIKWLASVYDMRRRLPESERPTLPPVRLILADWLSINQALEEMKSDEWVKASKYLTKLADIIYNGRELNVCLLVDLQSYNLAAVGLKADRNSRKNFNLIGLGNYSIDELGMVNESYGVLPNLIGDRYIVADESERTALIATFKQLQPISKANCRKIIFSGLSPARLALLPDLRKYKTNSVAASKQPVTLTEPTVETQVEESVIAPAETTNELKISDSLAEPLKSIWLFAKKKNDWVSARDVYNNGMSVLKGKGVKQIRQYFGLLADSGFGEIDEMEGDKPKSDSSVGFRAN